MRYSWGKPYSPTPSSWSSIWNYEIQHGRKLLSFIDCGSSSRQNNVGQASERVHETHLPRPKGRGRPKHAGQSAKGCWQSSSPPQAWVIGPAKIAALCTPGKRHDVSLKFAWRAICSCLAEIDMPMLIIQHKSLNPHGKRWQEQDLLHGSCRGRRRAGSPSARPHQVLPLIVVK